MGYTNTLNTAVVKRDGSKECFSCEKMYATYERVVGNERGMCSFDEFFESFQKYLAPEMSSRDIHNFYIRACLDLVSVENAYWQYLAGRLVLIDMYKQACRNRRIWFDDIYTGKSYRIFFYEYIKKGYYTPQFQYTYTPEEIEAMGEYLQKETDFSYTYTTMMLYKKRYLLNPNGVICELPQEMYMSLALFLAMWEEKDKRFEFARDVYRYCSQGYISLPTPTLLNARTAHPQLASCFKMSVDDDLRAIYHAIQNMAQISKFGGGIGVYVGNIRSKGASIRGNKGVSGGVIPWIKVMDDTAVAVNQLGVRTGAISVTLDIWHRDIYEFLDMQTETGDVRRKAFNVFPAVSIPDLFMKRVEENAHWTLFDPKEVFDVTGRRLSDFFGADFEEFYVSCEHSSLLTLKETVSAKDLFKKFLKTVVETGMPYVFFRDTVNAKNPNKHVGNIYSTQLCTEICQNTSPTYFLDEIEKDGIVSLYYVPGDFVVCNLLSINLAKVHEETLIETIVPLAVTIGDIVIDANVYPVKEAEMTAKKYRSLGVGYLGLAELLARKKLAYDSSEAREYVSFLMEKYAYEILKASCHLAKEKGKYFYFDGSEYSKGILFGKDASWFGEHSFLKEQWKELIQEIQRYGLRFGYHIAPAPNTSTAGVIGTTGGVLPTYKKFFVETNAFSTHVVVAPGLSQENYWYYKEYVHLDMKDVIDMIATIYEWVDQSISFEWLINPMKTTPQMLYEYYMYAWKKKIKTIYYVRSMSLEVSECLSCSG